MPNDDAAVNKHRAACHDCGREYGGEHSYPDLIIPFWAWQRITPATDDAGLLCPTCICLRLQERGIRCVGALVSGPIDSITETSMNLLRRDIELAIEGRENKWSGVREMVMAMAEGIK